MVLNEIKCSSFKEKVSIEVIGNDIAFIVLSNILNYKRLHFMQLDFSSRGTESSKWKYLFGNTLINPIGILFSNSEGTNDQLYVSRSSAGRIPKL